MTSAKGRRWYIYPSRTKRSDWGLHQVFQDHRARFQQCRPSFTSVAAPPQGDLASVGFEKAGIANQTVARDVGIGDRQGSVRNKRSF